MLQENRRTYSVAEAAVLLGVHRFTLYAAIRRGEFPVIRLGRRLLISRVVLDQLLSSTTGGARH